MKGAMNQAGEQSIAAGQKIKERNYWLNKLSGELNKTTFPFDLSTTGGPAAGETREKTVTFKLQGSVFSQLMRISNNSDLRLHILLIAAVVGLLHRYTGSSDIIIGTPIYKQKIEAEFVNTVLILRNPIQTGALTFKQLVMQTGESNRGAIEHQNYPLKTLLYQLKLPVDGDEFPLFDVALLLENIQDPGHIAHIRTNFTFSFSRTGTAVEGRWQYNSLRYSRGAVEQIAAHFVNFLERALANTDIPIPDIDILSAEEKRKLVVKLNDTRQSYPSEKTIPGLFEEQAERTPDNIALDTPAVTYGELKRKSGQLARRLIKKGVTHGSVVGIMVERSAACVVSMLAVQKAGGAYLPISVDYPDARKVFMLKDSGANVLLTRGPLIPGGDRLRRQAELDHIIDLDNESIYRGGDNPETVIKPGDPAYVIYTSGTTGTPKGVIIEHRALINFIYSMYRDYNGDFGPGDRCLSLTNISFDVSVCEIFLPLVFGSRIVPLPEEEVFSLDALSRTIVRRSITFAYIPPGLLRSVYEKLKPYSENRPSVLNKILVGVEPIKDSILEAYKELNPSLRIVNGYGPTEATICASAHPYDFSSSRGETVPIGTPLANNRILILDTKNCRGLQPPGVPGELVISGDGLARGYINRPLLTADKFVPNPHYPGERMYRTGDLARLNPDGTIQFLGRVDQQVKIRGYRIEPGEVEKQLLFHPNVKEAVVLAREGSDGDKYLCAYIVPHTPYTEDMERASAYTEAGELRDHLLEQLPEFMIPAFFVQVEKIPLTRNGKVDGSALPNPRLRTGKEYVPPKNEMEAKIADAWKEILKLDKISVNDNFFELGGNSLSLVMLNTRIKETLGREVPDVKFLEYPTISAFTGYLQGENGEDGAGAPGPDPFERRRDGKSKLKQRSRKVRSDENARYA